MMFYIFVGLEILTKKCSTPLYFWLVLISFHLMYQFAFSCEVVIAGPVAFQSDYGHGITLMQGIQVCGIGIIIISIFPMKQNATTYNLIPILMTTLNYEVNSHNKTDLEIISEYGIP
jgi:hypothetical protein